jgi:hypothetical protein
MGGGVGGGATGGTWTGGAGTWTNANSPANATYTASATESGTITLTLTTSGGSCGTTTVTKSITVHTQASIITPSLGAQARCINTAFTPISVGTGIGLTYQWYSNTTASNSGGTLIGSATSNTYTPPSNLAGTTYYYVVVSSATCGTTATSAPSGAFVVNPLPVVSFTSQPATGNFCVDTDLTYTTQTGQSNYIWSIPGIAGTDYSIISGGTSTSNTAVIRWLTSGSKSISVNYTDPNGCGNPTAATSNTITILKNTVSGPSNPNPSACYTGVFPTITHTTTGATGISNPGVSGANGLPLGLSATWSAGVITISGTVDPTVTPGPKPYSILLTGGCGTVSATGVIDVQPQYTLTDIASVSPSNLGGAATISLTVSPTALTNGSYVVNYQRGLANPLTATNVNVNFVNGVGVFSSPGINNEDLTSLTINSIRKSTDPVSCPVPVSTNNITFFGIQPKVFDSNGTFYVPAGIFSITVKVYGGGGGGGTSSSNGAGGGGGGFSEQTISVVPGEAIGIFVGAGGVGQTSTSTPAGTGGTSWATRDSSVPNLPTTGFAFAYGGAGANDGTPGSGGVGQTTNGNPGGTRNPTPNTGGNGGKGGGLDGGAGGLGGSGSGNRPGSPGVPFGGGGGGSKGNANGGNGASGYVIITYPLPPVSPCFQVIDDGSLSGTTIIEFTCSNVTWTAPEGLLEFNTVVGGGGGGGGAGRGSGGGGAGGLVVGTVPSGNPIGFPANTSFSITAGQGGAGASNTIARASDGQPSSISGTVNGSAISFSSAGGGGGGSENLVTPGNGINGASGGGGGANNSSRGNGGNGHGNGKNGGNGDFSTGQAFAGGGGGGISEVGGEGKGAGLGQGEGGKGGNGVAIVLGDSTRYFGAGGGGVGFNFNGTVKVGLGGLAPNSVKMGGDGSVTTGLSGVDKTGSGGGAGRNVGSKGGNGIVYIYYENFSILPIDYLYFNAKHNPSLRTSDLTWATAKEWENSHFVIERAVNDVKSWETIGQVAGAGYSDKPVEYAYQDLKLPVTGGNIFYRLKQVDLNGKDEYSITRAIQVDPINGSSTWVVYPNPSSSGSNVKVELIQKSGYREEPVQVLISDIRGIAEIYSRAKPEEVGKLVNTYLEKARPGVYILQLVWGDRTEQHKLLRK